ncbi:MAG TPA: HXXEE domain-containing protein [Longimicrobium sp.]|nr:HXXEE domain-containing protein [Longimicrobium sp.]
MRSATPAEAPRLSRRAALLLVPLLITLHDAEEALAMPAALRTLPARVPAWLAGMIPSYPRFLAALAVVTLLPWMVWLLGVARRETHAGIVALLLAQTVMLVNVASHAGAAILVRGYAPGVATALALNLPFSLYLLRRAAREGWLSRHALVLLGAAAVVVHGPGLLGLMWLAGRVAGAS